MRHKIRPFPLILALLATSALAQPPPPADEQDPQGPLEDHRRQLEREVEALPDAGRHPVEDVVRFSIEEVELVLRTALPPTPVQARVQAVGLRGITRISVQDKPEGLQRPRALQLLNDDFSLADGQWIHTSIFAGPGYLQIARDIQRAGSGLTIQMIQSWQFEIHGEDPIRLYVREIDEQTGQTTTDLRLSAPNVTELRRRFPAETGQYLRPILRDLRQEAVIFAVEPRVAWQVFPEAFEPEPEMIGEVRQLVEQFDADDFQQREAAFDRMQKLGQPAALVLLSMDRTGLSPEQNSRIDAFLSAYQPLDDEDVQRLRNSPDFLIDSLYSDQRTLRAAAFQQLQEITGEALRFDSDAGEETRGRQIAAIRRQLTPVEADELPATADPPAAGQPAPGVTE